MENFVLEDVQYRINYNNAFLYDYTFVNLERT
jgi:hypothetical protein